MGLGGHLLWTSVVRTLHESTGERVRVCETPSIVDLVSGRLYRGDRSFADDPVFTGNPRIEFPPARASNVWQRAAARASDVVLRRLRLRRSYERFVFALARRRFRRAGQWHAHIDMSIHSYAAAETPARMVWRGGGHIIDILCGDFGARPADHQCEMYFSDDEERGAVEVRRRYGLGGDYVVIEPNSKEDWFSDLRVWPFDRWQAVVDEIHAAFGGTVQIVQVGEGGRPALDRVINLSGHVPFRVAVLLMREARLFLGLEGGLMHAANAVGVPAVIVWGGTTMPEFAAYPERHQVLCRYVECAPCGLRGDCPHGKKCLTSIAVSDVAARAVTLLQDCRN